MKTYRQHLNDTAKEDIPERIKQLLADIDRVPPPSSGPVERGEAPVGTSEGGNSIRH